MLLWLVLSHLGLLGLLGLSANGLGARLLRSVPFHSAAERVTFRTAVGLGAISHSLFLLGVAGRLNRWSVIMLLLGAFLLGYPSWSAARRRLASTPWGERLGGRLLLGGLLLFLLAAPLWLMPLFPPIDFDATSYHLALAKMYSRTHAIQPVAQIRYSVFPQLNELLFSAALLIKDDLLAQLVQFLMMGTLALGLYAWGRRHFTARAGLWAAALWVGNPLVFWLGSCAYIDVGLTLYCALGTYAFCNWLLTRAPVWLAVSATLAGLAASSKYLGLVWLAGFGLWTVVLAIRQRRLGLIAWFALPAAVVTAPWYLYNTYHTGNPVFPFLSQIFGYSFWNAEDLKYQLWEMKTHGTGKSLASLLLVPWNLTFHPSQFAGERPLTPLYFFALPVLLWTALRDARVRVLVAVVGAYTLFWFSSMQIVRYLMPALPMLSLATVVALQRAAAAQPGLNALLNRRLATWLVAALLVSPAWAVGVYSLARRGLPPVTPAQRDAFIQGEKPLYPAFKFLNDQRGSDYHLYTLHGEEMGYYADGVAMGDWFGFARYTRFVDKLGDSRALYGELRAVGADHFLFARFRSDKTLLQDEFFHRHFRLVHERPESLLFALVE